MRRRFLVAVLLGALAAGCGGDDGPGRFDFSGTWDVDIQTTENTYPDGDDEAAWSAIMSIDQDGSRIEISLSGMDLEGRCDRDEGTFEAVYHHPDQVVTLTGSFAPDGATLAGTYFDQSTKDDDHHLRATWTARRR